MTLERLPDPASVAAAAARRVIAAATASVRDRGVFHLALAGGSTPKAAYALLATADLAWGHIHLWWGDERCVPHDHPDSNQRMAREALVSRVPIPAQNVHPISGELAPAQAAAEYERELIRVLKGQPLDMVLLGMGADGHTLSLFPAEGWQARATSSVWCVATEAPPLSPVKERVSLTLAPVKAARERLFLVTGADKRPVLERVLHGDTRYPAAAITGATWLVDAAAAPAP